MVDILCFLKKSITLYFGDKVTIREQIQPEIKIIKVILRKEKTTAIQIGMPKFKIRTSRISSDFFKSAIIEGKNGKTKRGNLNRESKEP